MPGGRGAGGWRVGVGDGWGELRVESEAISDFGFRIANLREPRFKSETRACGEPAEPSSALEVFKVGEGFELAVAGLDLGIGEILKPAE